MNRYKKVISMLLTVGMVMTVAACGSSSTTASIEKASTETGDAAMDMKVGADTNTIGSNSVTDWPQKTITIIVPFNAGGDTDFHARNLATYLSKILGVNVVVSNVAGANGSTGMYQVMDSTPDGYTALFFHDSMLTNKVVDVAKDSYENLEPVAATVVDNSYVLAVNVKSEYKTLDDIVNAAKANPGKLLYASSVGGYSYFLGRQFEELNGIDFNIVDAGGGTDRNAALLAQKIDMNCNPYGVMKSYFDSGDFRPICNIASERNSLFPDVSTAKEQGYDWIAERNYFLSFPKGTDQAIITKMEEAMRQVCEDSEFIKSTETAYCVTPTFKGREDLLKTLADETKLFEDNKELIQN